MCESFIHLLYARSFEIVWRLTVVISQNLKTDEKQIGLLVQAKWNHSVTQTRLEVLACILHLIYTLQTGL